MNIFLMTIHAIFHAVREYCLWVQDLEVKFLDKVHVILQANPQKIFSKPKQLDALQSMIDLCQ
jgi:hypothetical protein